MNANTNGACDFIVSLKSSVCPADPVVWTLTPGTRPIVAGTTSLRSSRVPAATRHPWSGIETRAACS